MDLNPWERRQKILEVLCLRRHDTYGNLAHEFNVSTGTIRRDIVALTCSYPIETIQGGHGGVRVAEWFHLDRRSLNSTEITFLRRLGEHLNGPDLEMLNRIIAAFSLRFRIEENHNESENQQYQNQSRTAGGRTKGH